REACEAYIRSQLHEGWHALSAKYDDGGFSGGNLDRPAMKRLMQDIADGKVNTVVVYKVDRLTRSLADFAKIIEVFDSKKVSFVSVTQQFNTTTSMGRLTLNVLLSFAQFEREVTGERIRDKIAASKAKGMWMGGYIPLGYRLQDRKLYIIPEESDRIREIFSQYLRFKTVSALKEHLDRSSIRSKIHIEHGERVGGERFSRGALYKILRNHIYIGEIAHKDAIHKGEHEGIIDRELWDQVQKLLEENRQGEQTRIRTSKVSLLTGLLFDEAGNRFIPTHDQKAGRRYRYYTSQAVIRKTGNETSVNRIPALDIEQAIAERVLEFLRSPDAIFRAARDSDAGVGNFEKILKVSMERSKQWAQLSKTEQDSVLRSILNGVIVRCDSVEIQLKSGPLFRLLLDNRDGHQADSLVNPEIISLACPLRIASQGKAFCVVLGNDSTPSSESAAAMIKAIARARLWYDEIVAGEVGCIPELARRHKVSPRYVKKILPCALLGPRSVDAILKMKTRPQLTLDYLLNQLPIRWDQQSAVIEGE
ncbi:MAG: recombinase family protein, partial [Silvibacterium sp.]